MAERMTEPAAACMDCEKPARYLIKTEHSDEPWPLCAAHTAEHRACDPLGYIESVRLVPCDAVPMGAGA